MMRLVTCICALTAGALCLSARSPKQPATSAYNSDVITVFVTGNELGELKPCGCSGGQLGGFDRRWAILNSVPAEKRLIIDTGSLVEGDSQQDIIKFNIIIQALGLLNYDLANLTEKDIKIAQNLGLLNNIGSVFSIISPHQAGADVNVPAKFTKKLSLKNRIVAVTVASFNAESEPIEQIRELFVCQSKLRSANVLIINQCDKDIIANITKMGIVDCLVCPPESDEPRIIGEPNGRPLVVSVGRFGKYVGRLQIRADKAADNKLKFTFSAVPVTENLPLDKSLVELYKTYQQWVKEENLFEKQPRFVLPDGLEYLGSASCKACHEYEYEKWSSKPHAHAFASLEKVGSEYDPECVSCHVVGAEYESGFISPQKTNHLKNVGCENCHGPGSKHIKTAGVVKTADPKSLCTDCHTPDRSANYAGNEHLYFEKIIHWREPNTADNVKKKESSKE